MSGKHTPGPWQEDGRHVIARNLSGELSYKDSICTVCNCYGPADHANAQLISSAPDMLAALQTCQSVLNAFFASPLSMPGRRATVAMNEARAAIAKATGGE